MGKDNNNTLRTLIFESIMHATLPYAWNLDRDRDPSFVRR